MDPRRSCECAALDREPSFGSYAYVPTLQPVTTTLTAGEFTLLRNARFTATRVTITAISNAEVGGVAFRVKRALFAQASESVGLEVFLRRIETVFGAKIEATTPEGVATLEITYVVKTGADAATP
jgi:hypothetical protein